MKILELVPNEKLTHDWKHGDDPESIVTWTLEDSGGGTRSNSCIAGSVTIAIPKIFAPGG